jgi:D-3-phosphoglycerate dehydrogenase / 2-oxoglutarate reductase
METPAQNISIPAGTGTVSYTLSLSTSPAATLHSPPSSFGGALPLRTAPKNLKPFDTQDIKILLLENVNLAGQDILKNQGYQVEALKTSLPEDQLIEKIRLVKHNIWWRLMIELIVWLLPGMCMS